MVPAYIPYGLDKHDRQVIWNLIETCPSYLKIFGPHTDSESCSEQGPSLANRLDGVVTSVSLDAKPFGYGTGRMFSQAGFEEARIAKAFSGDIGGIGFVIPGQEDEADTIKKAWTGLKHTHLSACAKRAAASGEKFPGVVALALGWQRFESVRHAIAKGYVSHVIVDVSLGKKLLSLLPAK